MKKRLAVSILYSIAVLFSAGAASVDSILLTGNLLFIGNGTDNKSPSPLVPAFGITIPIGFTPLFSLEPGIDVFQCYYEVLDSGKVTPTQMDTAGVRLVWGILLSPRCFFTFPLSEKVGIGLYAAPGFYFPIPGQVWDDAPTAGEFASYLYGSLRFFYPEAGFRLTWQARDTVALHFNVRSWWPLFNAWDGEDYPFYDQLMISAGVGFSLSFDGFRKKDSAADGGIDAAAGGGQDAIAGSGDTAAGGGIDTAAGSGIDAVGTDEPATAEITESGGSAEAEASPESTTP